MRLMIISSSSSSAFLSLGLVTGIPLCCHCQKYNKRGKIVEDVNEEENKEENKPFHFFRRNKTVKTTRFE